MGDPPTYRSEPDGEFADRLERLLVQRLTETVPTDARREARGRGGPTGGPDGGTTLTRRRGDDPLVGGRPPGRRSPSTLGVVAAVAAAVVVVGAVVVATRDADDDAEQVGTATSFPLTTPAPPGWVALDDEDGDIYLVRPGEQLRRLDGVAAESAEDACPAWSPDGTRLSFGRVTGPSDAPARRVELVIVPIDPGGTAGNATVIALDGFEALPGDPDPCAIWAPDGRWLALAGGGRVWVVDSDTGAIRHLPDLRPTDLEWRPGTDEIAIAGDAGLGRASDATSAPVVLYSVSADEQRPLGSVRAAAITWSPDGSTLAYKASYDDPEELWLVDADGTDPRPLTRMGAANHGIGPVWSPTGDRIAYQRLLDAPGEKHEVVLVDVADGTETVIQPPRTDGPNGPEVWFPWSVTWSPDGTTLLYSAWSNDEEALGEGPRAAPRPGASPLGGTSSGVLAVDADAPTRVTVLTDRQRLTGVDGRWWVLPQAWGPQPR